MKVLITKEQFDLFESNAAKMEYNGTYYYLPYWYKDLGDGYFEQITFEKLPEGLKEIIKENR